MKHIFKDTNTITISGWMVNNLKLSGNELLIYAMIYGFSQDGESEFYGSLNYICSAVNCSKPTAIKTLNSLVDRNLIFKLQSSINGINFSKYRANIENLNGSKETLPLVNNLNDSSKDSLPVGSKETLPNNNTIDNNNNKKDLKFFSDSIWNDYQKLKDHFASKPDYVKRYAYCDLKYYIERADHWSETSNNGKGTKRTDRGWLLTVIEFIERAKLKNEMRTIEIPQKSKGHTNH